MTDLVLPLPPSDRYGFVVVRIVEAIADTAKDVNDKPEGRAAQGTITFTPAVPLRRVVESDYKAIVVNGRVSADIGPEGFMLDAEGRQGVWLVAGKYTVSFAMRSGMIPGFEVEVTDAHTATSPLDLATVA